MYIWVKYKQPNTFVLKIYKDKKLQNKELYLQNIEH